MLRDRTAFAGSLRNASAVAAAAQDAAAESIRKRIAVIAAGEHWPGGNLRPAIEDLLGAGAIIERLQGRPSPEARAARAAYRELTDAIPAVLSGCPPGPAPAAACFTADFELAPQEGAGTATPSLPSGKRAGGGK